MRAAAMTAWLLIATGCNALLGVPEVEVEHEGTAVPPGGDAPDARIDRRPVRRDVDGDGKADLLLWRSGAWLVDLAEDGFGNVAVIAGPAGVDLAGAVPVPARYDGDLITDLALWTPDGRWCIDYASDGSWDCSRTGYTAPGAVPLPANYDGDGHGVAELAIRDVEGTWLIDRDGDASTWEMTHASVRSSLPAPGDFNGDGVDDIAVYTEDDQWFVDQLRSGKDRKDGWDFHGWGYGGACIPAIADYDADGKSDISAIRCAGSDYWFIDLSAAGGTNWDFKLAGRIGAEDVVVPANYDGAGGDDLAVVTATEWRIDYQSNGFVTWDVVVPLPAP